MEKNYPKIDIPIDYMVGTGITEHVLNLYRNYPCRLNAEIFVLCREGNIDAVINLNKVKVRKNDFVTISPGSIIQIEKVEGNLQIYFMIFSSGFIQNVNIAQGLIDFLFMLKSSPVINVPDKFAELYEDYFKLMIRMQEINRIQNTDVLRCMLMSILYRLKEFYQVRNRLAELSPSNRNEEISNDFARLVTQFYAQERNISFYAARLNITPTHLSNTVKLVTGHTVIDIIAERVINDAKAQLKSTNTPINEIAESLNFSDVSFFGKYFKRYVGMTPLKYRNS